MNFVAMVQIRKHDLSKRLGGASTTKNPGDNGAED
jgi:hypothetical protein